MVLNPDLIEHIQATPDTLVTLTSGRNYLVLETPEEIIRRVVEFRRTILNGMPLVITPNEALDFMAKEQAGA